MSVTIRATNMAEAFINAAVSNQRPWVARKVMENCERESAGLKREFNNINISGRSRLDIDTRLQKNLPGLCGEFRR